MTGSFTHDGFITVDGVAQSGLDALKALTQGVIQPTVEGFQAERRGHLIVLTGQTQRLGPQPRARIGEASPAPRSPLR